jgi:hypothetical protein
MGVCCSRVATPNSPKTNPKPHSLVRNLKTNEIALRPEPVHGEAVPLQQDKHSRSDYYVSKTKEEPSSDDVEISGPIEKACFGAGKFLVLFSLISFRFLFLLFFHVHP